MDLCSSALLQCIVNSLGKVGNVVLRCLIFLSGVILEGSLLRRSLFCDIHGSRRSQIVQTVRSYCQLLFAGELIVDFILSATEAVHRTIAIILEGVEIADCGVVRGLVPLEIGDVAVGADNLG